jgi:hypothetical protein
LKKETEEPIRFGKGAASITTGLRMSPWVTFDRGGGLYRAAHFRFAPKADVTSL